jgi:uncharacterized membrane protein
MEAILGVLLIMGGAILALLRQIAKLQSDKKLSDIKVADAKLEEKQINIQEEKTKLKEELQKVEEKKSENLSDTEIEKYWENYKK